MSVDIIKENAQNFLSAQLKLLSQREETLPEKIMDDWWEHIDEIFLSLVKAVQCAEKQYRNQEGLGSVSSLRHIYISWLRTSLQTKSDLYRIDLYDEKGLASLIECTAPWTPPYTFGRLQKIMDDMRPAFEKQTAAKLYSLEELIYQLAEKINEGIMIFLKYLAPPMLDSVFPEEKDFLQVHGGEFFDHTDLLFKGAEL